LEQKGEVSYQLELPPQLSAVHDVFQVSQLKKCLQVLEEQVPLDDLVMSEDLTYQEYPASYWKHLKELRGTKKLDVQGSMEPPHKRRGHLGKRRRAEHRIPKLLC
jgi:hypothetical protein